MPASNAPDMTSSGYTVRESVRIRRACLKVSFEGRVEVVVPRGFDHRRIPAIVHHHQMWLDATLKRMALRSHDTEDHVNGSMTTDALPETIVLPAIAETWRVTYMAMDKPRVTLAINPEHTQLILRGNINDAALCKAALQRWLVRKAQQHLTSWLEQLSHEKNLPFKQVQIRSQKMRWGSCNRQKKINLNCKLLFLPASLVQCVLVHELCHTVHMNHSSRFWTLMEKKQPDYAMLDAQLRKIRHCVPGWMEKT